MDDIINYAFEKSIADTNISIIKKCLDAGASVTNKILRICISSCHADADDESDYESGDEPDNEDSDDKILLLFDDTFGKSEETDDSEKSSVRQKLFIKIFDLLLKHKPFDLIIDTDLLLNEIKADADYCFIKKIIKTNTYTKTDKLLYMTLSRGDPDQSKILLDAGLDIYLPSVIMKCVGRNDQCVLRNLIKLNINVNDFRSDILSLPSIFNQMVTKLINYIAPPKHEVINYMLFSHPSTRSAWDYEFNDIFNYILSYYVSLIHDSNNKYVVELRKISRSPAGKGKGKKTVPKKPCLNRV